MDNFPAVNGHKTVASVAKIAALCAACATAAVGVAVPAALHGQEIANLKDRSDDQEVWTRRHEEWSQSQLARLLQSDQEIRVSITETKHMMELYLISIGKHEIVSKAKQLP